MKIAILQGRTMWMAATLSSIASWFAFWSFVFYSSEKLPHNPNWSHEPGVLGAVGEQPLCLPALLKDGGTLQHEAGKRAGWRHHPSHHDTIFLISLFAWLLAAGYMTFRSSAFSNRRKLNINNRLFPSRLLFVNKEYKWNKAGKIIITPCSWFSDTWSTCSFPQASLELEPPSVLAHLPEGHPHKGRSWQWPKFLVLSLSLSLAEHHFRLHPKYAKLPMLWLRENAGPSTFWSAELVFLWGVKSSSDVNPSIGQWNSFANSAEILNKMEASALLNSV